ncbi:MAG: hypothetical protein RL156_190 [Bacteroidota bacterium]
MGGTALCANFHTGHPSCRVHSEGVSLFRLSAAPKLCRLRCLNYHEGNMRTFGVHLCVGLACVAMICAPLYAQFGQNKVQYQDFSWKYVSSEHFDVYYHEGLQTVAEFCAVKSEEALRSLTRNLSFRVPKRINIVVYGSHNEFQQTNVLSSFLPEGVGGVTELFKNRIVLPYDGDWERFRHVIHHELVHAFLNEMLYSGSIKYALQTRVQLPLWMNEGLAEFESLNGMDNATDMFMRDITLNESLPSLDQLSNFFAYRGGQAFYSYVAETYGRGKIAELISKVRAGSDINAVFRSAFGLDLEQFSEKWQEDMKRYYYPDLDKFKRLDDFAKRLTNHIKEDNYYNSSPAISPDGSRMAFISYRDGDYGIYVTDIEKKSEPVKLVSSQRELNFEELNVLTPGISWSPSGDKLAITAKAGGEDALFIVNARTGSYEKYINNVKSMTSAAWSPDGNSIAVVAVAKEKCDLYVFTLKTKKFAALTNDVFTDAAPCWSADSKSIYFISDRDTAVTPREVAGAEVYTRAISKRDIYRVDVSTKVIERITNDPFNNKTSVAVSKDEKSLLYIGENNGIGNLYHFVISSGKVTPKTNSLSGLTQISLARDETKLLFAAQHKGSMDIFMIRNPFEQSVPYDTLPLTKLKVKARERDLLRRSVAQSNALTAEPQPAFTGYGIFDIDVKRSRNDLTNPDIPVDAEDVNGSPDTATSFVSEPRSYKTRITNDLVYGGVGYNSLWNNGQGTIEMLFSDLLGNHVIYASLQLWSDLRNSNFTFQYEYLPKIIDYSFRGYHRSFIDYMAGSSSPDVVDLFSMRNYGITSTATFATSKFQRWEASLSWMGVDKTNETTPADAASNRNLNFLVPEARYVFDNSQMGFFAPYKGLRLFVDAKVSPFTKRFGILTADVRQYFPIWKQYYGLMLRASGGTSFGPDPRSFFLGGVDNWISRGFFGYGYQLFRDAEDFAFLQIQTPLRGFELAQVAGKNYALANAEFRFPFFSGFVAVPVPFVLLGAVFLDVGTAWNDDMSRIGLRAPLPVFDWFTGNRRYYDPGSILLSTGIGVRTVLLGYPFKVDVAWRRDGDVWSEPQYVISLGLDL